MSDVHAFDYTAALEFLMRRINYERTLAVPYRTAEFKLERMRKLLALVGDPHVGLKAIHIAGTKGKGSTAAMMAAILQAAGYRTGLYTSPHLERIEERIVIDGQMCPEEEFAQLAAVVAPAVDQLDREAAAEGRSGPTFFEVTTAMAFLHFSRRRVDAAVLEVGLGGRLDSTNVCQPEVCIITNISFDHVKQLGNTLAAIASEKAGIIKPGVPVVAGELAAEPRATIAAKAAELSAPLYERGTAYNFCHTRLPTPHSEFPTPRFALTTRYAPLTASLETLDYVEPAHHPSYRLDGVRLAMLGRHQAANAAAAICAANRLRRRGWSISDEQLRRGLAAARCPGRMEQLSESPTVIVDVAHNVAAIEALLAALGERYAGRRRIAIFASSKDKDYRGMLRRILGSFDVVILTQYVNNPRAMEAEGLLAVALELRAASGDPSQPRLHALVRPPDAWHLAQAIAGADDLVCITGSFFLVAELRPLVLASERSGLRRAAVGQST